MPLSHLQADCCRLLIRIELAANSHEVLEVDGTLALQGHNQCPAILQPVLVKGANSAKHSGLAQQSSLGLLSEARLSIEVEAESHTLLGLLLCRLPLLGSILRRCPSSRCRILISSSFSLGCGCASSSSRRLHRRRPACTWRRVMHRTGDACRCSEHKAHETGLKVP